jgi:glycine/D-amino acid oxidase-like deaminating enzyme
MRIAVLGAGFSGLSVAWHLQQMSECEIVLFDRKRIGGGASGMATGLLHPYVGEQGRRSVFATEGIAATKELIGVAEDRLGEKIAFQEGIIRYVQNEEQRQMFLSHRHQFGDVRQHGENSFWIQSGMTIDCPRYLDGLWHALAEKGVQLVLNEITDLSSLREYDQIVVAAGAGVKQFPELDSLRISNLKGQVLKCRTPSSLQLPEASTIGKGYLALSQEPNVCFIGSTYQRGDFTDTPQSELAKEQLFPNIRFFFPEVARLEVIDCRAAFRVMRMGHYLPIATRVKDNVWVLTAMGSRGLLYHAYIGKVLARDILRLT